MAAAEGRLHEVQSLLDGGKCKVNDEDEVCTSRGSELVYENIVVCVVCVCTYVYLFMCTYVSMAVHKLMQVSIGLSEFHGYKCLFQGSFNTRG